MRKSGGKNNQEEDDDGTPLKFIYDNDGQIQIDQTKKRDSKSDAKAKEFLQEDDREIYEMFDQQEISVIVAQLKGYDKQIEKLTDRWSEYQKYKTQRIVNKVRAHLAEADQQVNKTINKFTKKDPKDEDQIQGGGIKQVRAENAKLKEAMFEIYTIQFNSTQRVNSILNEF